ncbi:GNAT family N-acetyltransferase [Streptomyces turgidiscabies]|uniref:GNAT family N-acetyltransferase n=1 Tax=Streptomyces turgidiscabies TaxID=85558 RepID=UPI0027D8A547|nr:GNAT family protein [Streptomyces turgidiscabies]
MHDHQPTSHPHTLHRAERVTAGGGSLLGLLWGSDLLCSWPGRGAAASLGLLRDFGHVGCATETTEQAPSRRHRQGDIAYIVHPRAWGRGVGTAIGQELLSRGFGEWGLHRIYATCDPRNLASSRLLGKLGMTYEGRHRHTALIRDGWRDSEMFSILEAEWRPSPSERL